MDKLSIVVPVYNGQESIIRLADEIFEKLEHKVHLELVLVNDSSPDDSWSMIKKVHEKYSEKVIAINLSKNFGEHNAVMAGYAHCTGDYIANIDDDFQNPPEEILKLFKEAQKGYEVVYSCYKRKKHHFLRNLGSQFNGLVATWMLKKPKALYLSSFRLISKNLLNQVISYQGPYPYIDGLILRSTNKISTVEVQHNERAEGQSNYTLIKLIRLWSYMFLNFSIKPLRFSSLLGLIISLTGFLGAITVLVEKLIYPKTAVGWPSLMVVLLIVSGVQLILMGLIGEYIGRIFMTQNLSPQYAIFEKLEKEI